VKPIALALAGLMLVAAATPVIAQQRPPAQQRLRQRPMDSAAGRARLEMEVRRNFARIVRQQVGLNDDQMRRLAPITQRYEQQRRQLQMQERDARVGLRQLVLGPQTADSAQVERLLQQLIGVQKRRVELLESEHRELAAFMSPMQRAKYAALQERIRRQLEQMRQRRAP
jgi:periplasmic protein CpxP/Spy